MGEAAAEERVRRAIAREPAAVAALVRELAPVVQVRVARALSRSALLRSQRRSTAQEVEDLTQEVFLAIFDHDARVLRAWDPARGASLATFIGMIAEHQVASVLRSGRRTPYRREADVGERDLDRMPEPGAGAPEARVASKELGARILDRLRAELSPRGFELFERLLVDEQPIEKVCRETDMTPDAVYAWRSRLGKLVRRLSAEIELMSESTSSGRRAKSGGLP